MSSDPNIVRENAPNLKVYDLTQALAGVPEYRILLLEDEPEFAKLVCMFLEPNGYLVTCALNGAEGLREIMARDFDIILCDLMMPTLPGDMFYLAVEKTKPKLLKRFIFMTGHSTEPKWAAFLARIRAVYLTKPFPMSDLLIKLAGVIHETNRAR